MNQVSNVSSQDVATRLQPLLTKLIALSLNGKQAHWHVQGHHFTQVHEQLDTLIADLRRYSDDVAERVVALGIPVDGRPHAVADASKSFPEGYIGDDKVVQLIVEQLDELITVARSALNELESVDLISQDIVIEMLRSLEKHRWMFTAQTASNQTGRL